MKNINKSAEVVRAADRVLLPDRYQDRFVEVYQSLTGREVPRKEGRRATAVSQGIKFQWLRGRDIPQVTALISIADPSALTVGLTGSEWCTEYSLAPGQRDDIETSPLSEERLGRVAVIAPSDSNISLINSRLDRGFNPVGVVTAYPNLIGALGLSGRFNIFAEVPVSGGVEGISKELKIPGVDLVSGGGTIIANDFVVVTELMDAYPVAVTARFRGENV